MLLTIYIAWMSMHKFYSSYYLFQWFFLAWLALMLEYSEAVLCTSLWRCFLVQYWSDNQLPVQCQRTPLVIFVLRLDHYFCEIPVVLVLYDRLIFLTLVIVVSMVTGITGNINTSTTHCDMLFIYALQPASIAGLKDLVCLFVRPRKF